MIAVSKQENEISASSHTPYSHYAVSDICHRIPPQHMPISQRNGFGIILQGFDDFPSCIVVDAGQNWRILHKAPSSIRLATRYLRQKCFIGSGSRFFNRLQHQDPRLFWNLDEAGLPIRIVVKRPHIQDSHWMNALEVEAVAANAFHHGAAAFTLVETVFARGNIDACYKPFEVPFPGAGDRFIEVIQVQDNIALGRAVESEVVDMSISINHGLDSCDRSV